MGLGCFLEFLFDFLLLLGGELFVLADGAVENFDVVYYCAVYFEVGFHFDVGYAAYGTE